MSTLKRLRKEAGLTEQELADLAGITRHAVLRNEQMLYTRPSTEIVNCLSDLTDTHPQDILEDYDADRIGRIHLTSTMLSKHRPSTLAEIADVQSVCERLLSAANHPAVGKNISPFQHFREALFSYYNLPTSRIQFCIHLCLHPAVVTRYETNWPLNSGKMPTAVGNALETIGVPGSVVFKLDEVMRATSVGLIDD